MRQAALSLALALCGTGLAAEELLIATGPEYPPYLYLGPDGTRGGLDAEIGHALCRLGGWTCRYTVMPVAELIPALAAGEVDVVMGGIGYSVERDRVVDFTCPYHLAPEAVGQVYARTSGGGVDGLRIAVTRGTLFEMALLREGLQALPLSTDEEVVAALASGRADAMFGAVHLNDMALERGLEVTELGQFATPTTGAAIAVSEDRPELLARLDELLALLSREGEIAYMQQRWLYEDQGDVIAECDRPVLTSALVPGMDPLTAFDLAIHRQHGNGPLDAPSPRWFN